jgi:hypothetical protein
MRVFAIHGLFVLVGLFSVACSPSHDGRLLVVVSTDLEVPGQLARVEVSTPLGTESFAPPLPFSFVVAAQPGRDAAQEVTITARGIGPDESVVVERVFRTRFLANRTLVVPITLARICTSLGCGMPLPCPEGSVCAEGGCAPAFVEPENLREARTRGEELSGVSDAGVTTTTPVPPDRFCDEFAAIQCDAILNCCPDLGGQPPDALREACLAETTSSCRMELEPVATDPRTGYDAIRAGQLFAEARALIDPNTCSLALVDWFASYETGIFSALRGTLLVGASCTPASMGDVAALFSCQASACTYRGPGDFVCAPRACNGEGCVIDLACADGLFCSGTSIVSPGQCEPRRAVGQRCEQDEDCESYVCLERVCRARSASALFCPRAE